MRRCKQSAYEWSVIQCESIIVDKGLKYMVKSSGTHECTVVRAE